MTGGWPEFEMIGPVLVFGGPYGNLEATQAVLEQARQLAIPADHVICTGDLAAYCADTAAVVDLVFESGIRVVRGNCDEQLANNADDCGCGFPEGGKCERLAADWFAHARRALADRQRAKLAALPRRIDLCIGDVRLAVVHAALDSDNQFIFASSPLSQKRQNIRHSQCDGVISGHCGLPFSQLIEGHLWHNAGVVGMPANDGTPRVWFSVLRPTGKGILVEHRPLDYDYSIAAAQMSRSGHSGEYQEALRSGLWPSCDVLPPCEIEARGQPLQEFSFVWPTQNGRRVAG